MSEPNTTHPGKRHATYRPIQSGMDCGFLGVLSANTLFPEAMDILEMTGELHLPPGKTTGSPGETLLHRFETFCRYYTTAQVRWVEGALTEIGYYFLIQDTSETPHPRHRTAIKLLQSVISTTQPNQFLIHLGAMKQFCARANA